MESITSDHATITTEVIGKQKIQKGFCDTFWALLLNEDLSDKEPERREQATQKSKNRFAPLKYGDEQGLISTYLDDKSVEEQSLGAWEYLDGTESTEGQPLVFRSEKDRREYLEFRAWKARRRHELESSFSKDESESIDTSQYDDESFYSDYNRRYIHASPRTRSNHAFEDGSVGTDISPGLPFFGCEVAKESRKNYSDRSFASSKKSRRNFFRSSSQRRGISVSPKRERMHKDTKGHRRDFWGRNQRKSRKESRTAETVASRSRRRRSRSRKDLRDSPEPRISSFAKDNNVSRPVLRKTKENGKERLDQRIFSEGELTVEEILHQVTHDRGKGANASETKDVSSSSLIKNKSKLSKISNVTQRAQSYKDTLNPGPTSAFGSFTPINDAEISFSIASTLKGDHSGEEIGEAPGLSSRNEKGREGLISFVGVQPSSFGPSEEHKKVVSAEDKVPPGTHHIDKHPTSGNETPTLLLSNLALSPSEREYNDLIKACDELVNRNEEHGCTKIESELDLKVPQPALPGKHPQKESPPASNKYSGGKTHLLTLYPGDESGEKMARNGRPPRALPASTPVWMQGNDPRQKLSLKITNLSSPMSPAIKIAQSPARWKKDWDEETKASVPSKEPDNKQDTKTSTVQYQGEERRAKALVTNGFMEKFKPHDLPLLKGKNSSWKSDLLKRVRSKDSVTGSVDGSSYLQGRDAASTSILERRSNRKIVKNQEAERPVAVKHPMKSNRDRSYSDSALSTA